MDDPPVIAVAEGCRLNGHGLLKVTVANADGGDKVEACADCTILFRGAQKSAAPAAVADVMVRWARSQSPAEIADALVDLAAGMPRP
jgi:hypothetical protein